MTMRPLTRLVFTTAALLSIGGVSALAHEWPLEPAQQPPAGEQPFLHNHEIEHLLGEARAALEQENPTEAEMALMAAHAALEEAAVEIVPGVHDELRTLIEAALDALANEDYAEAQLLLQEAEGVAGQQEAAAPDNGQLHAAGPTSSATIG